VGKSNREKSRKGGGCGRLGKETGISGSEGGGARPVEEMNQKRQGRENKGLVQASST